MVMVVAALLFIGCSKKSNPTGTHFTPTLPAMTMINIPAGTFQMAIRISEARSRCTACQLGAFAMSQTLVTQKQFQEVIGYESLVL